MIESITPLPGEEPLSILARCGGYYECPKRVDGSRLGPLVGYAGRDEKERQYVGDIYANFAKAEQHGLALLDIASKLFVQHHELNLGSGFCGAPEGGKALATILAVRLGKRYIFPEKKVTAVATLSSREKADLVFSRHVPEKGENWWIVEDVCNNFSTTAKLVALIESHGAHVLGVACFLNRSLTIGSEYTPREGLVLPVLSCVRKQIEEFEQDHPAVEADIKAGNVVWKPKNEWQKLEAAMQQARQ